MSPERQTTSTSDLLPARQSGGHLAYLDAVRGLAALSVVIFHYSQAYGPPPGGRIWTKTPLNFWLEGQAAVSLFFVLSGFVLSFKYFRSSNHPDLKEMSFAGYGVARLCRLWIPYLAMLAICVALPRAWFERYSTNPAPTEWVKIFYAQPTWPYSLGLIAREANLLNIPYPWLIPQGWTLGIELVVSLLVPVAILIAARNPLWLVAVTLLAMKPLGANVFVFHFMLGIIMARYYSEILRIASPRRGLRIALLIGGVVLYTSRVLLSHPTIQATTLDKAMWMITGIGAASMLIVVLSTQSFHRLLSAKWMRNLGRTSYSLYLLHMAVLMCVTPLVLEMLPAMHRHLAWMIGLIVTVAVSLLLAEPMYRFVESPSIAMGKRGSAAMAKLMRSPWSRPRFARPMQVSYPQIDLDAAGVEGQA